MPEELASLVLDHLPGAVIGVDLDGRVTTWNRAAERMFGWSAAELIGRPLPIVPDEGVERRRRWLERAAQGEDVEVTTQRRHRDGRILDVVVRYSVLRDAAGEIVGWASMSRDAKSQLRTATRLQRSQAELALIRRLAGMVQGMLQDLDVAGVLKAIVEAGVDLAQADAGAVSLQDQHGGFFRMVNVNIPSDLTSHAVQPGKWLHGAVIRSGEPMSLADYDTWEGADPKFRGRGFHASLAVPIRRGSSVNGVLAVHSTVPRRRFPPEALDVLMVLAEFAAVAIGNATVYRRVASEREKFLALVQAMPEGLAVVEGGVITAWNAAAARLTDRPADAVIGQPPPFDLDEAVQGVELVAPDGRHQWLQTVGSTLPDADARVYLIRDVTEQRDLERAKDLFFATTSHELKTPLTVVKGLASTLRKHWERMDSSQRNEALETIERRAEALDRLIERILVGSRVQAGALDISPTPVDVVRLIDDVVPGFAAAATGTGHDVRADVPEHLPLVAGDKQAIDTILGHLLENAIKYSPGGGEIVVSAAVREARIVVEVSDRGIGIEGGLERLLAPFVQADSRTTRRFGGVGLGLYIVRQLLDQLDGNLWAANRDGGGATFGFSLALWPAATPG